MAQTTTGWRSIFSMPTIYRLAQSGIGSARVRSALVDEYLRPAAGEAVLDIGCGTGDLAPYFDDAHYVGYDLSVEYIEAARSAYSHVGEFRVGAVGGGVADSERFDRAVAKGVLHHLDDPEARTLFAEAYRALRPGGMLVTIDPCFDEGQSRIARTIISRDRGQNVRTPAQYRELACDVFEDVDVRVRSDLLRVPYSHAVVICRAHA